MWTLQLGWVVVYRARTWVVVTVRVGCGRRRKVQVGRPDAGSNSGSCFTAGISSTTRILRFILSKFITTSICIILAYSTWLSGENKNRESLIHEVSRLLAHLCATVCRRSSRTRHWLLDISSASWKQRCLHESVLRVTSAAVITFVVRICVYKMLLLNWTELISICRPILVGVLLVD